MLAACQAMLMTGGSLLIATSALVGYRLAPDKALATLPLAMQMLASMLTSIPASLLMQRFGRRAGFLLGSTIGISRRRAGHVRDRHRQFYAVRSRRRPERHVRRLR